MKEREREECEGGGGIDSREDTENGNEEEGLGKLVKHGAIYEQYYA